MHTWQVAGTGPVEGCIPARLPALVQSKVVMCGLSWVPRHVFTVYAFLQSFLSSTSVTVIHFFLTVAQVGGT